MGRAQIDNIDLGGQLPWHRRVSREEAPSPAIPSGERVAQDVAEVGDRRVDFTDGRRAEGIDGEIGDDRRRFVASEPVQQGGEDSQRDVDRTVLPASSKLRIPTMTLIEHGQRVAVRPIYRAGSAGTSALMSSPCRSLTVSETSK